MIPEPVTGFGANSGDRYMFGENGPETVIPGAATAVAAAGGSNLKAQAAADAKAAGAEWAKSGATWFNTAQTSVKTNVTTPLTTLAGTTIPAAFKKSAGTWYDTHAATLQSKVATPLTTLIGTTVPAAQNKAVPTWYNTHAATLQSKITTPVSTWINTTVPGAQNKTIPHLVQHPPGGVAVEGHDPGHDADQHNRPGGLEQNHPGLVHDRGPDPHRQSRDPAEHLLHEDLPTTITTGFTGAMTTVGGIANRDIASLNAVTKVGGISPIGSLHFSRGGVMPGYEPGKDTMNIMVGGGEGILVPEAVRGLGGAKAINAINRKFAGYRGAGRFADGGISGGDVANYATGVHNLYTWVAPPTSHGLLRLQRRRIRALRFGSG